MPVPVSKELAAGVLATFIWLDSCLRMSSNFQSGKPKIACEIAADRVIAARASDSRQVLELCSTSELAPGCVVPDLTEENLLQRAAVVSALKDALGSIGARSKDIVAV